VQSGLTARQNRLGGRGYHDAFPSFGLGHGQAARQSLESCASCHAERDCTSCHSAVAGGFRFSPHGPGFNADRLRKKNPGLCVACHGRDIPGAR
jgi:predicted CXXCH cytochrome family protein